MVAFSGFPGARAMSGQPRPEKADPAGTYTVRVTYDGLKMENGKLSDPNPPKGVPVSLVAYGADDSIVVTTKPTDSDWPACAPKGMPAVREYTQAPMNMKFATVIGISSARWRRVYSHHAVRI